MADLAEICKYVQKRVAADIFGYSTAENVMKALAFFLPFTDEVIVKLCEQLWKKEEGKNNSRRKNDVLSFYKLRRTNSRNGSRRYPHLIRECNMNLRGLKTPKLLRKILMSYIPWEDLENVMKDAQLVRTLWRFVFPIMYEIDPASALRTRQMHRKKEEQETNLAIQRESFKLMTVDYKYC